VAENSTEMLDRRLGRIEVQVDKIADAIMHLAKVEERQAADRLVIVDHEVRIRTSEQHIARLKVVERIAWGLGAAVAALGIDALWGDPKLPAIVPQTQVVAAAPAKDGTH